MCTDQQFSEITWTTTYLTENRLNEGQGGNKSVMRTQIGNDEEGLRNGQTPKIFRN